MNIGHWVVQNPSTVVSIVSAVIAALSLYVNYRNNKRAALAGKHQTLLAEKSADAAEKSAKAAIDGQRAYLVPLDIIPTPDITHHGFAEVKCRTVIHNIGKTAAFNISVSRLS